MKIKVSVIQDNPVFFDKEKSLEKLTRLVKENADDSNLILFPESFIPGYPRGIDFGARLGSRTPEGREVFRMYRENSFDIHGPERTQLEELASVTNCYLAVGVTEREANSGSLYCSLLYFSPSKGFLGSHRKIKPTGMERTIWGEGDGSTLIGFDTSIGRIGGLICWENLMPHARMSMYNLGLDVYLAPTADCRETWAPVMRHIAMEGRCFVLSANQYFTKSMYPEFFREMVKKDPEELCAGGSMIVSPMGTVIEGPLFNTSGVLKAELDLGDITRARFDFDPAGHYNRKDIFRFETKGQPGIIHENELCNYSGK